MPGYGTQVFPFGRRRLWISIAIGLLVLGIVALVGSNLWAWNHFRAADRALRRGDAEEAHRHISQALRVWPRSPRSHLLAARIERRRGQYTEAEEHLLTCLQLQNGTNDASQLETLLLRAQTGELPDVEKDLWACVEAKHPESSQILETLAGVYIREARLQAALRCLNCWLEREPQTAEALHWRGWVQEALSAPEKAVLDYQQALEIEPGRWGVRLRLVRLLVSRYNIQEAEPHIRELQRNHSEDAEVQVTVAQFFKQQGESKKALAVLDRVLATHPDDVEALSLCGDILLQTDPVAAAPLFQRVLNLSPADQDIGTRIHALYALYKCLERQGKAKEAGETIAQYERVEADAKLLTKLRDTEVERSQHHPDVLSQVGELYLRLGQEKKGLEWLYKALTKDPDHKATHKILVEYYESKGKGNEAAPHRARLASLKDDASSSSPNHD